MIMFFSQNKKKSIKRIKKTVQVRNYYYYTYMYVSLVRQIRHWAWTTEVIREGGVTNNPSHGPCPPDNNLRHQFSESASSHESIHHQRIMTCNIGSFDVKDMEG
jgi:hypothetical protein